ncbi:unnamed protein product [Caenorhabditis auriculariae]|uniref:Uncharacterized protein n=1 Tax=Caenorhabditis auriculariae TaxID=2777116 RepID=A0A8S1HBS6_9PELO|nr:unnamed protein product [Caenorhabditis auriculariae]
MSCRDNRGSVPERNGGEDSSPHTDRGSPVPFRIQKKKRRTEKREEKAADPTLTSGRSGGDKLPKRRFDRLSSRQPAERHAASVSVFAACACCPPSLRRIWRRMSRFRTPLLPSVGRVKRELLMDRNQGVLL